MILIDEWELAKGSVGDELEDIPEESDAIHRVTWMGNNIAYAGNLKHLDMPCM